MLMISKPNKKVLSLNTGDVIQNASNLYDNINRGTNILRIPLLVMFGVASGSVIGLFTCSAIVYSGFKSYFNDIMWAVQTRRLGTFILYSLVEHREAYAQALIDDDYSFFEELACQQFPMFYRSDLNELIGEFIKKPR